MIGSTALLMLALTAPPKLEKIEVPKVETPKLKWEKQAPLEADGLTTPDANTGLEAKKAPKDEARPGGPSATVDRVTHARDFLSGADGSKPRSLIHGFDVAGFPARIEGFKSCLRLKSKDRSPAIVKVSLLAPSGAELLSSRGEVSFNTGDQLDYVVDWEGFDALTAGEYKLVVTLDGKATEFVLPVREK